MINWKKLKENIPAQLKLGNSTYEVLWATEFPKDKEQLGECRFEEKQIIININQSVKEQVLTLYHEVFHSLSFEHDINLTEKQVLKLEKSFKDILSLFKILDEGSKSEVTKRTKRNTKRLR